MCCFLNMKKCRRYVTVFTQILTVLDRVSPTQTLFLGQRIMRQKIMMTKLATIMMSIMLNNTAVTCYTGSKVHKHFCCLSFCLFLYYTFLLFDIQCAERDYFKPHVDPIVQAIVSEHDVLVTSFYFSG